jgi:hypothetical protein
VYWGLRNRSAQEWDENGSIVRLHQATLKNTINYSKAHIDYLLDNDILYTNGSYVPGEYSRGYQLRMPYSRAPFKRQYISRRAIIKRLTSEGIATKKDNVRTEELDFLKGWLNDDLSISDDGIDKLKRLREHELQLANSPKDLTKAWMRYNSWMISFDTIKDKRWYFYVDSTSGRLHTPLTILKSELRSYLRYRGERLVSIDIVNSQPFLLQVFLDPRKFDQNGLEHTVFDYNPGLGRNPGQVSSVVMRVIESVMRKEDVLRFVQWVNGGRFYEEFALMLNDRCKLKETVDNRKQAKLSTFEALFGKNRAISSSQKMQCFKKVFPNVYEVIMLIKRGDDNYNALACSLQRFESNLILHTACKAISERDPSLPLFTIHDSIATTVGNEELVRGIMRDSISEALLGVEPPLKVEKW